MRTLFFSFLLLLFLSGCHNESSNHTTADSLYLRPDSVTRAMQFTGIDSAYNFSLAFETNCPDGTILRYALAPNSHATANSDTMALSGKISVKNKRIMFSSGRNHLPMTITMWMDKNTTGLLLPPSSCKEKSYCSGKAFCSSWRVNWKYEKMKDGAEAVVEPLRLELVSEK